MEVFLWILYWTLVFVFPMVYMKWLGKDFSWNKLNFDDVLDFYIPLVFLSFLWPLLLGFVIFIGIVALAIAIILGVFGLVFSIVGCVGGIFGVGKHRTKDE